MQRRTSLEIYVHSSFPPMWTPFSMSPGGAARLLSHGCPSRQGFFFLPLQVHFFLRTLASVPFPEKSRAMSDFHFGGPLPVNVLSYQSLWGLSFFFSLSGAELHLSMHWQADLFFFLFPGSERRFLLLNAFGSRCDEQRIRVPFLFPLRVLFLPPPRRRCGEGSLLPSQKVVSAESRISPCAAAGFFPMDSRLYPL